MICENCNNQHSGDYGSGRFCSKQCAKAFSSKQNRVETNIRVSQTLRRKYQEDLKFKKRLEKAKIKSIRNRVWSEESKARLRVGASHGAKVVNEKRLQAWLAADPRAISVQHLSRSVKNYILAEQNRKCKCGTTQIWQGKPLVFHVHHLDGDDRNNRRDNLEMLCPNCHSQTETWGFKNSRRKSIVSSEENE